MAKTPTRMAGPALLTDTAATKYTVPGVTTAVIRLIHFSNEDSSSHTVTLSIGADAAGTELLTAYPIAAHAVYDWYGYLVMTAAEVLQAFASVTNVVNMTVSGDQIT